MSIQDDITAINTTNPSFSTSTKVLTGLGTLRTTLGKIKSVLQALLDAVNAINSSLASKTNHFGTYTTLAALQAAYPTATSGDTAEVDAGAGHIIKLYAYDAQDGWQEIGSGGALGYTAENSANRTDDIANNSTSSTKYTSAKAAYDYVASAISSAISALGLGNAATKNVGATPNTVCAGDDSRLSNSRPASDVYSWAKQTAKPSYNFSEIGSVPTTLAGYSISNAYTKLEVDTALGYKQAALVSGNNIKTINGNSVLGSGDLSISFSLVDNTVTNAKLYQVSSGIFKGRSSAGTGVVEDLNASQATAMLNVFGASVKGLVPAASASPSASKFLTETGTWAVVGSSIDNDTTRTSVFVQSGGASTAEATTQCSLPPVASLNSGNPAAITFTGMYSTFGNLVLDGNYVYKIEILARIVGPVSSGTLTVSGLLTGQYYYFINSPSVTSASRSATLSFLIFQANPISFIFFGSGFSKTNTYAAIDYLIVTRLGLR